VPNDARYAFDENILCSITARQTPHVDIENEHCAGYLQPREVDGYTF
jgi:hypothetical protein